MTDDRGAAPLTARERYDALGVDPLAGGFAGAGAVLVLLAFVGLDWFHNAISFPTTDGSTRFFDVPTFLDAFHQQARKEGIDRYFSTSMSGSYFSWLGWLLLVLAGAATFFAVARFGRDHWSLRWLGAVVSATSLGLTFLALDLIVLQGNPPKNIGLPSYGDYLGNSSIGAWAAIAGFLLMLVASLMPRRDS